MDELSNYSEEYLSIDIFKKIIAQSFFVQNCEDIRKIVNNARVRLTKDKINKYLSTVINLEKPALASNDFCANIITGKLVDSFQFEMLKDVVGSKQMYIAEVDSYTLEYFNIYINNLKIKLNTLLDILDDIEDISNKKINNEALERLNDLDINLDTNGFILKEDAIRLVKTLLYNLSELLKINKKANTLKTYLTFSISEDSIYRFDLDEKDIYPSTNVQVKDIFVNQKKEFIQLSNKQKEMIKQDDAKSYQKLLQMMNNF